MTLFNSRKFSLAHQYLLGISLVLITSLACFAGASFIGYKTVALLLLLTVSVLAMLFDILPVLTAAMLSALIWNFFFIPPLFTFHIERAEDLLMFLSYFFIALVNAVLTLKIRKEENKVRDQEEKEKTIKLYNTLLNSLSHELRTPIATILGAVDTLKENKERISAQNQDALLDQIEIASIRLNGQVENLLNMSRLETGMLKLNSDWCDLNELIHGVIQKIAIPYRQTLVFKANDSLPLLKFDRGLIEQVLLNLIHNAILYTPESTLIEIRAERLPQACLLVVSDNGPGISETDMAQVFDKFYRIPHTKAGGSGLGLSIVKGFTEAHGGHVWAKNNADGGVSFYVEFPAEASAIYPLKNE